MIPHRIFVSAGEPSGDARAAEVVRAVRSHWPLVEVEALGGPALREAGARIRFPMEQYTVLGFIETLGRLVPHLRLLRDLDRDLAAGRYDAVLLVDYPGFNLHLAARARRARVRTLYYIAPQLWAWRPRRARRLQAGADRLAVILPFETPFFARLGIRAEFVGHPLVDGPQPSRSEARQILGVPPDDRVLALLPGSRPQEVNRLWPAFREAAEQLLAQGRCDRVLAATVPGAAYPGGAVIGRWQSRTALVLAAADAALVKSGTSTLEAAWAGTPMVVAYRVHPVTAALARRLITVRWVSLVNLVAGREVVPELLQDRATPAALSQAVGPLLEPEGAAAGAQRQALRMVRERLGPPGAPGRVAAMLGDLLAA